MTPRKTLVLLPVALSLRIILLCFVSLPLFFVGLVGYGGESLSQFLVTVLQFLFWRRRLRYYIDAGEPEPPKEKGLARIKAFFKKDRDAIRYKQVKQKKGLLAFSTDCFPPKQRSSPHRRTPRGKAERSTTWRRSFSQWRIYGTA